MEAEPVSATAAGGGQFSLLVENIAAFCREHSLEEKILVVPSRIVGRQISDSVARALSPGGWVNLRIETVATLAHSVAGRTLAGEGRSTLSRAQRLAIVEKVCGEVLTESSYFGALRRSPGFHRALSRTIDELRSAGFGPEEDFGRSVEDQRKSSDLMKILRAYETEVGAALADPASVLQHATLEVRSSGIRSEPWVLVPTLSRLSASESEFLNSLAGDRLVAVVADDPASLVPARADCRFVRAVGEENELREIFRKALAEDIPFDKIEILYSDRSTYLSLAYELTRQYGIPATFVDRIDVAYTKPGRAVLGFLDWLMTDFGERELRSLILSGSLDVRKLSGEATLGAASVARVLRRAKIGWGRARYSPCLKAYSEGIAIRRGGRDHDQDETSASELAARAVRDAEGVQRLVGRLLAVAPVPTTPGNVTLAELSLACSALVEKYSQTGGEIDGVARAAIPRVLEDLSFLGDRAIPIAEAAERVREAIAELFVGGSSITYPRPGSIHFAGYEDGGYTGRPQTFVVGLDESRHPGSGLQDPVLLDRERRRLNASSGPREISLRGEAPQERSRSLLACLARLRGTVTLSFSCHDLADDREMFPSAALVDIFRNATESADARAEALGAAAGPPSGYFAHRGALDATEWWLANLRGGGRAPSSERAVRASYPGLEQGRLAREARLGPRFTRWDGLIESAGTSLDPRESSEVLSASRLQLLADCPFAYFVKYVLRVEPPEEIERDPWIWLAAMDQGSLLHETFRDFMAELGGQGRKPESARDRDRMMEIADSAIERWRRALPPPDDGAVERHRRDIYRACETFLKSEERESAGLTPRFFEVAFGLPDRAADAELGAEEPVVIPVGGGKSIRVRGSIDRVDLDAEGTYAIWDYKTGSSFGYEPREGLKGGKRIQHALYAAALEEMLRQAGKGGTVSRAGYIFTGPREDGQREDFGFDRAELRRILALLADRMRAGAFIHTASKDGCSFCRYESICGGRATASEAAERKGNSPSGVGSRTGDA